MTCLQPPRGLTGDTDRVIRGGATISCPASPPSLLMSLYYMSGSGLTPPPVIRSADKHSYLRPEIATMSTEVWGRMPRSEKYVLQVHVLKSFEGSRYITTLILILDGGTAGNELRYPINRRLCGPQKLPGRFGGQKTSCSCRDSSTTVRECVSNYV